MSDCTRPEYPRPQFAREDWLCLNGDWQFCDDPGDEGEALGHVQAEALAETIQVPFCREAPLSGIHRTGRVLAVWYKRHVTVPSDWAGQRLRLHFGAVDYQCTVWVDGVEVGAHEGGHCSFTIDVSAAMEAGREHVITIRCRDDWRDAKPRGKQVVAPQSFAIYYTRTTGIWQSVWLEPVPASSLRRPRITPQLDQGLFLLEQGIDGWRRGLAIEAVVSSGGEEVARARVSVGADACPTLVLAIPEERRRAWSPSDPHLYDLTITLRDRDDRVMDRVSSYAGLRSVAIEGDRVLINGEPVFQRLILDQGYWPEGLLTAPSDDELVADIERAQAMGFNGARFHQKIVEERQLYHADRLGYLVWGELPDWISEANLSFADQQRRWDEKILNEWLEELERDYSHPCIVGWCPLNEQECENEGQEQILTRLQRVLIQATHLADRTRPILDASGWPHRCSESDIYDSHDYTQDPATFAQRYQSLAETGHIDLTVEPFKNAGERPAAKRHVPHRGQPFMVSEFGGIPSIRQSEGGFSYGKAPGSVEEFVQRFAGLCAALQDNPHVFGYCYTQLVDVEHERNGLYTYAREAKVDPDRIRAAHVSEAAIERRPASDVHG